ncbi:MAG: leucine-rich repeat domain-containing protein [Ruminiclostridium sp.]|nr:leucine-rich repeat domain-containing protein [Ruminiclostridium sp.]
MNDKNKRLWENSLDLLDEEIIGESAQTLYKKSLTDFDENDFVIVETEKKSKFPIFALVASIIAIIGVAVITGVIITNTGIFTTPLESEDESSITSEYEIPEGTIGKFGYSFASDGSNGIILTSYSGNPTELVIPETIDGHKVVGIHEEVFRYCQALKTLTIPKSVNTIRNVCFDYCESLEEIKVDSDNEYFCSADGVLFDKGKDILIRYPLAKADKEYVIPDSVSIMENKAFAYCKYLTAVTVSTNVGCVSHYAFLSCEALKSVTLSEGVTGIGDYSFESCKALEYLSIPESVKDIRETALRNCDALIAINVAGDNTDYCSVDGVLFSESMTELIKYPACKADEYYSIPEGVTDIASDAFYNCKKLNRVNIPDGVSVIEDYTFYGSHLTYVDIPYGVAVIGENAFSNCPELSQVTIPVSVTEIGEYAFNSTALKYVTIPKTVISIGREAFGSCNDLTDIDVDALNIHFCSVDGVLFSKDMAQLKQYPIGRTDAEYTIPDGVEFIGGRAFYSADQLENVTFPDGIISIGAEAFAECRRLTCLNLPDTVNSIGDYAFKNCTSITSVNLSDSSLHIRNGTFSGCHSLKSVYIPGFGTSIGENAFDSHVFITGAPLIRNVLLIASRVIPIIILTPLIISEIRKKRREKREIAEYYRRRREEREKSGK